jgi:MFS family permease
VLLDPRVLGHRIGWRACFALGALLGFAILLVRRYLPESPRWLLVHGRAEEAEAVVEAIEAQVCRSADCGNLPHQGRPITIEIRPRITFRSIAHALAVRYRKRTGLGLALMIAQAFFYNAIFFTYSLILSTFYGVPPERIGWYILPFAAGNCLGPLVLGRLFDTIGRRPMIAVTYALSGVLLLVTAILFERGVLTAFSQTLLWTVIFFIASTAASSAYLTVSEVFPLEIRAMAIAVFYAVGTGVGGLVAPAIFGALIGTHDRRHVFHGYVFGAALMLAAAAVAWRWGVAAERRSLEEVAASS